MINFYKYTVFFKRNEYIGNYSHGKRKPGTYFDLFLRYL